MSHTRPTNESTSAAPIPNEQPAASNPVATQPVKYNIYVPEARSCRYDSKLTPENIYGLYTDEFSHCNIVIVFKKEGAHTRISMTHLNEYILEKQIENEIQWVGQGATCIIVARETPESKNVREKVLPKIGKQFTLNLVSSDSKDVYGITIDSQCKIHRFPPKYSTLPLLCAHPTGWKAQAYYRINLTLDVLGFNEEETLKIQPLFFDGQNWNLSFEKHDKNLIDAATYLENSLQDINIPTLWTIGPKLKNFLTGAPNSPNEKVLTIESLVLTYYFLQLISGNDSTLLFSNHLDFLLSLPKIPNKEKDILRNMQERLKIARSIYEIENIFLNNSDVSSETQHALKSALKICSRMQHHAGVEFTDAMKKDITKEASSKAADKDSPVNSKTASEDNKKKEANVSSATSRAMLLFSATSTSASTSLKNVVIEELNKITSNLYSAGVSWTYNEVTKNASIAVGDKVVDELKSIEEHFKSQKGAAIQNTKGLKTNNGYVLSFKVVDSNQLKNIPIFDNPISAASAISAVKQKTV